MKSAYEIAMEKLRKQDAERSETRPMLTAGQKEEIAGIRQRGQARLAEREILHQADMRKAAVLQDPEAVRAAEESYRKDRARIEEETEAKVRAVRLRQD